MATFNFTFTYPDNQVLEFAKFLWYTGDGIEDGKEYIATELAKHTNQFTTLFAEHKKQQEIQEKANEITFHYDTGLIAEIKSSLVSTIE